MKDIKQVIYGRIKSLKNGKEKILNLYLNEKGYQKVGLYINGKLKHFRVNRLIATAFIPNPENKPEVNHKDTNKLNNRVSNLEWNTRSENMQHAYKTGLIIISEKRKECGRKYAKLNFNHEKNKIRILQYDLQGNFIKEWESMSEAARQLNINQSAISLCCLGKRNKTGGYVWRYKDIQ